MAKHTEWEKNAQSLKRERAIINKIQDAYFAAKAAPWQVTDFFFFQFDKKPHSAKRRSRPRGALETGPERARREGCGKAFLSWTKFTKPFKRPMH